MRGKRASAKILCALGVISLLFSVLLWSFLIGRITRLPGGLDMTLRCDTTMTWYFDPVALVPLPEGKSLDLEVLIQRRIYSADDQYSGGAGVLREEVSLAVEGLEEREWESSYVVDRGNFLNLKDERAYSCAPENFIDRSGYYYPLFPRDISRDGSCDLWREEVSGPVVASCIGEDEYDGVDVLVFAFAIPIEEKREVNQAVAEKLGLSREIGFAELERQLTASGVDVAAMLEQLAALATPADLEALALAREKAIPVKYYLSGETELAVQPRLGVTVDIRRDTERISIEVDPKPLLDLFILLSKYSSDPVIGEGLQRMTALSDSLNEPMEVFEFTFGTSRESMAEVLDTTRDALSKARLLDASPWFFLLLGALLLVPGLILLRRPETL